MNINEFIKTLPEKVNQDAIAGHNTRFHFDIAGEEGGQFTVSIDDGIMNAQEGIHGDAKCVVKAKAEHLSSILKGEINPMTAVFTGKLKISNPGEMMKYAKIFGLM